MKSIFRMMILSLAIVAALSLGSCTRINAGCEGIKVNLYGDSKGVDNVNLVTGMVWYNPITTEVYEYETYVQTVDYPAFKVNAKDGSEFIIDPTISLKLIEGQAPIVFKKYRKELSEVISETLYNYVKNAFRIQLNAYTTDEIVSNRDKVEKDVESALGEALKAENFQLEQLTSGLQYPETIVQSVDAKNKAVQEAMRVENEIRMEEAKAQKVIIAAEAEAKANAIVAASISDNLVKWKAIDTWDGKLPVYGTVPTFMKTVQ